MNVININNLNVNFGDRVLLDDVSLGIHEGDKIGIIGANGNGKTTLLRIIAGDLDDYLGEVILARDITISYLPQTLEFVDGNILDYVKKGGYSGEIWDKEGQAKNILTKLGITEFDRDIESLSGGQKKRVALARVLLHPYDILILDEPTNHLDSNMIEWLEGYLKDFKGVLIMVTHDRYFLDIVTNKIVEIDQSKLYVYNSNYEGFLNLKCQREDMELASERKRESILKNELKWVMRGARARSTKQKSRLERFEEMNAISKIQEKESVEMESVNTRMGKKTVELVDISKSFNGQFYIHHFNYLFLKNERIGIVGGNGCGKSTLLNIIAGQIQPDAGEVIIGDTIKIAYFTQYNDFVDLNIRVIDYLREVAEYLMTKTGRISASQMLERFLFTPNMQYTTIGRLSGGEKRRLYLLKILMEAPNVLILDEPTNDLDIMTLQVLEDYLDGFDGIIITVSHDRYFLDRVVNRILAFELDGSIQEYMGGYTDYYEKRLNIEKLETLKNKSIDNSIEKKTKEKPKIEKLKFTYKEEREFETIEQDIEKLELQVNNLDLEIEEASTDFIRLNTLIKEKEEIEVDLENKMDRWIFLNEKNAKIDDQKNNGTV